jgi:hypothetical protein
MEKHISFHYLYMQQLPQALLKQLREVQPGDPRGLATRADRLLSVHAPSGGVVALAEGKDSAAAPMAAVKPATRGRGGKFCRRGGGRGSQQAAAPKPAAGGGAGNAVTPAADPIPSDLERMSSGLFFSTRTLQTRPAIACRLARG